MNRSLQWAMPGNATINLPHSQGWSQKTEANTGIYRRRFLRELWFQSITLPARIIMGLVRAIVRATRKIGLHPNDPCVGSPSTLELTTPPLRVLLWLTLFTPNVASDYQNLGQGKNVAAFRGHNFRILRFFCESFVKMIRVFCGLLKSLTEVGAGERALQNSQRK